MVSTKFGEKYLFSCDHIYFAKSVTAVLCDCNSIPELSKLHQINFAFLKVDCSVVLAYVLSYVEASTCLR